MAGMCSFVCCFLLFVSSVCGVEYPHTERLQDEAYKVHWKFDNYSSKFYFKVVVNATGWIGFGVSELLFPPKEDLQWNRHSMDHYDVVVGGVLGNQTYFKDYKTNGHVQPIPDTKQESDWKVNNLTEIDGWTSMEFERKQNTGDPDDKVIGPGRRWMVWSYHKSSDVVGEPGWEMHTANGYYEIEFIKEQKEPPMVDFIRTEVPTSGALAATIIGNFLLMIIVLIFFY